MNITGSLGVIVTPTRGAGGAGEVDLEIMGGHDTYLAWSDEPLARGTKVVVMDVVGLRTVEVQPLT